MANTKGRDRDAKRGNRILLCFLMSIGCCLSFGRVKDEAGKGVGKDY
jgi:hypothetical protein